MSDSGHLKDEGVDLSAWKLKVHSVDMALRELQNQPEKAQQKPRTKMPFMRSLPSRL
jgi:hypothetical protein